jgi:hypothetical protein
MLPNFVVGAVAHTGCAECEERAGDLARFLDNSDEWRIRALWLRAADAYDRGYRLPDMEPREGDLVLDPLEQHLVRQVQAVQRTLQRLSSLERTLAEGVERGLVTEADAFELLGEGDADNTPARVPAWVVRTRPAREAV